MNLLMRRREMMIAGNSQSKSRYITFTSPTSFTLSIIGAVKLWDGIVEYSTDTDQWTEWDGLTTLTSGARNGEYVMYFRGTGNTILTGPNVATNKGAWHFAGSNISISGIAHDILDYRGNIQPGASALKQWFGWKSPGDTAIVSAENFIIPDPLSSNMCTGMFSRCKGLVTPPKLTAETMIDHCYESLFYQCEALEELPALPALTLANLCYNTLFSGCTKIKMSTTQTGDYQNEYRIPIEGEGINATQATYNMFISTGGTYKGGLVPINQTLYTVNTVRR